MRHVARKFKISMYKTTAHRPQSNRSIERSHHVLMEYLKQCVAKRHWDKYLTHAMKAYNTSVHGETEFTQHDIAFGRTARVPASNQLADDNNDKSHPEYERALFMRIFVAQVTAREDLNRVKIRSKRYYDRRTNPQAFEQGDYVYLSKEPLKSNLEEQYIGPYKILETLDNNNVRLEEYYVHLQTLSNSACPRLHETGTLSLRGSAIISGATPNNTMISTSTTRDLLQ